MIDLARVFGRQRESRQHVNPDGTLGGLVPNNANVSPDAYIGITAVVMAGANVRAGEVVESGEIVLPSGRVVRFNGGPDRFLKLS